MKLASYIAKRGRLLDWLIALRHFGRYSHSELVFSDGMSFSSSSRDGGTRFVDSRNFDRSKWEFVTLPVPDAAEAEIRLWCEGVVGAKYDWAGVLAFINPFRRHNPTQWFCSEIVAQALKTHGFLTHLKPEQVWPSQLHDECLRWANAS